MKYAAIANWADSTDPADGFPVAFMCRGPRGNGCNAQPWTSISSVDSTTCRSRTSARGRGWAAARSSATSPTNGRSSYRASGAGLLPRPTTAGGRVESRTAGAGTHRAGRVHGRADRHAGRARHRRGHRGPRRTRVRDRVRGRLQSLARRRRARPTSPAASTTPSARSPPSSPTTQPTRTRGAGRDTRQRTGPRRGDGQTCVVSGNDGVRRAGSGPGSGEPAKLGGRCRAQLPRRRRTSASWPLISSKRQSSLASSASTF